MIKRKTIEEYVETIFFLQNRNGNAKTGRISSQIGVQPSSVTEMLQKLQEEGYIQYEPYKGAKLTETGKILAHELMSKHKIIADFLEIIGVQRELAEADACQIEHHVTTKTMQRLGKFVEFINDAPHEPKWIEHFNYYIKTGKRKHCNFYEEKEEKQ
ncbi:MAG: metal-dependent transcriptional regulator [Candidatus Thermoplasmatota archaeon]